MKRYAVAVILAALCGAAVARAADSTLLYAVVGKRSVAFTDSAGARVAHLTPGAYTIKVRDGSSASGFWLRGPGVNRRTGRPYVGRSTWTLKLRPGTYVYGSSGLSRTHAIRVA
jgi:hypothetical protein